jgi:hypothetical protein
MVSGEDVPAVVLDLPLRQADSPAIRQGVVYGRPGGLELGRGLTLRVACVGSLDWYSD